MGAFGEAIFIILVAAAVDGALLLALVYFKLVDIEQLLKKNIKKGEKN
jgi:hypothetical protein